MKKISLILLCLAFLVQGRAQETGEKPERDDRPVRSAFESGILIDAQTNIIPDQNTLEMIIQHKFGPMTNGFSDLFGIYAPGANVRINFNYSILDKLMVGYGLTKTNMTSDFQAKWAILQQTRSGHIPVAVTVYGNLAIDGRPSEELGINYSFINRLSYFAQVIVGRKFTNWFTLQANASFSHFNLVPADQTDPRKAYDHNKISFGVSGRLKFSSMSSVIFTYDDPLNSASLSKPELPILPKPKLTIGYEVSTGPHAFQIYAGTANGILPQHDMIFNQNDIGSLDGWMFGFTITRLWGF